MIFCSLAKPEHIEKLFNYVTKEPEADASENVKFRYGLRVKRDEFLESKGLWAMRGVNAVVKDGKRGKEAEEKKRRLLRDRRVRRLTEE